MRVWTGVLDDPFMYGRSFRVFRLTIGKWRLELRKVISDPEEAA